MPNTVLKFFASEVMVVQDKQWSGFYLVKASYHDCLMLLTVFLKSQLYRYHTDIREISLVGYTYCHSFFGLMTIRCVQLVNFPGICTKNTNFNW